MKRALVASIMLAACSGVETGPSDPTRASAEPLAAAPRTPREAAEHALGERSYSFYSERESLTGHHELFVQTVNGLPVLDAYYAVHLKKDLSVDSMDDASRSVGVLPNAEPRVDEAAAVAAAQALIGVRAVATADKVVFAEDAAQVAWRVQMSTQHPFADWEIIVSGNDGSVLRQRNRAQSAQGSGMVFVPNPVDTSGIFDLADNNNADSEELTAQRKSVTLLDLDGSGTLTGTYATTTSASARANNARLQFNFTRSQDAFEETMAYYHITTMQHYIQSLGFTNINNRQITANVNTISDDNSFYSPMSKQITFGNGGVDDAEDATVIYHEAGHAIHDNQVPGWGSEEEGGAMGEGFGDYWAASNFNTDIANVFVGTWDAVSYNPGTPAFLRRLDTTKRYPGGMDGEVHDDGEIWSACLWQLWGAVGKAKADTLILESHFRLTPRAKFVDGANAIVKVNEDLYKGADAAAIRQIFVARGILR